jgi:hypothetical protein
LNPEEEALGRSKGGFSTKLHLACDGKGRPLSVMLSSAGQRHSSTQLEGLLDAMRVPRAQSMPGRPRKRPDRLLRRRGISHTIPERKDQKERRAKRLGFDGEAYPVGATWSRGA